MIRPNARPRFVSQDGQIARTQGVVDRHPKQRLHGRPGWLPTLPARSVNEARLAHEALEKVRPGGGVQIAEHDDWHAGTRNIFSQTLKLLVTRFKILAIDGRQRMSCDNQNLGEGCLDVDGDRWDISTKVY